MCDRSFSDASRGLGIGVLPHIRDALEQARVAAEAEESHKALASTQKHVTRRDIQDKATFFGANISKHESSLLSRLADSETQIRELRAHIYDALQMQKKKHAYLRVTHLDPAVGLEIELNSKAPHLVSPPILDTEALVHTTSCLMIDQLRQKVIALRTQLREVVRWNEHLEQERDDLYKVISNLQASQK